MYMIRGMWRAQRGKAPEIIAALKMVNQAITAQEGFSNGKIYADMSGPFDTIVWQFEAESLDRFYQAERGVFINPDADTQRLIDTLNGYTVEGRREIYEVIV
jgi:hypothetical protein